MRGLKSTIALIAVAAGLGAYIYFVDSDAPAGGAAERAKVFTVEADKIQEMRVTSGGETTVLKKADGTWMITEPVQAEADTTEITSLTSNLATLEQSRVVDENATDLAQYGLAPPVTELSFTAEGNVSGKVAFGEKTPTQGDLYAVFPGEKKVFLVPAFAETTFAKKTFDLRDKRVLKFERDKVDRVEISHAASPTVAASREGSEWMLTAPFKGRADYAAIEATLTRLGSAAMSELVAEPPPGAFDKPAFALTVAAGSTRATLTVSPEIDGRIYARDEARKMVFTIEPTLQADLQRTADDLRAKDVFEFRPFNADRLRITQGNELVELEKVPASGDAPEKWRSTVKGQASDADTTAVDDLLSKLTGLRAQSFVATLPPATGDAVVVAASFDGGKFERVRLHSVEAEAFSTREGEPGAGRLDGAAVGEALKAIDALGTAAPKQ